MPWEDDLQAEIEREFALHQETRVAEVAGLEERLSREMERLRARRTPTILYYRIRRDSGLCVVCGERKVKKFTACARCRRARNRRRRPGLSRSRDGRGRRRDPLRLAKQVLAQRRAERLSGEMMKTKHMDLIVDQGKVITDADRERVHRALQPGGSLHDVFAEAMGLRPVPGEFARCMGDGKNSCEHGSHAGPCRGNLGHCACLGTPGVGA